MSEASPLKIFITGAGHGVGLTLARLAARKGYHVFGATDKGTVGAMRIREAGGLPLYTDLSREGDIRSALSMSKADVVVNCEPQGALGLVQAAFDTTTWEQRIRTGTQALVTVAAQMGVKHLIHLSAAYALGDTGTHAATEEQALKHKPSLFDAFADAEASVTDGGISASIARSTYIYGGTSDASRSIAEALQSGAAFIKGTGAVSFIHEDDLAAALLLLVETEASAGTQIFNIAPDKVSSHDAFLDTLGAAYGIGRPSGISVFMLNRRTTEFQRLLINQNLLLDTSKIKALGWKAQYNDLLAGIERTLLVWRAEEAPTQTSSSSKELVLS